MSSISPNTGSCCPPGGPAATGGGPVLDPALDAGPTGAAPAGSNVPPPPGTGELPGASAPTGFDAAPVDVAGGGPAYLPAPVALPVPTDVGGVSGAGAVDPGSSTASVTGGGPEAVTSESIIAGGGPGGAPMSTGQVGIPGAAVGTPMGTPQPLPGWNANYGDAFAKAFDQAGVDPATASAALHSLAAMGSSAEELDQALEYLQTEDGASLAPYMADELASQAPSYARAGMDRQGTEQVPGGAGQVDPTTGQPTTGAPTPVGQTEDGGIQMSDGSITYEDGSVIQPDGTMVAPDGSTLSPDGVLTRPDGTTAQIDMETGQEIDPATGQPIDPNIDPATGQPIDPNATGAPGEPPAEEGGMPTWGKVAIGAGVVGGLGLAYRAIRNHNRAEPQPLPTPDDPARVAPGAPDAANGAPRATPTGTPDARPASFAERFAQNRAEILGDAESTRVPRAGAGEVPRVAPNASQARAAALREAMGQYGEKGSVPFREKYGHLLADGKHNIQGAHRLDGVTTARAAESVETLAYRNAVKNIGKHAAAEGVGNLGDDVARGLGRHAAQVINVIK